MAWVLQCCKLAVDGVPQAEEAAGRVLHVRQPHAQLLITVLGILATTRDIATFACVSGLWAKAAGLAVPKTVNTSSLNTMKISAEEK